MKNKRTYANLVSLIISIGGLLLGISANISGASELYRSYFNLEVGSFIEGLIVSAAMAGTFIGNLSAGTICDRFGRKRALAIAAFLFSFCTLGSALATTSEFLLISRFIGGLGIGISLLVSPLFIAEIAPPERRGFLVSFNQLNIGIGYLLSYLLNSAVYELIPNSEQTWRWMFGIGFIFPLLYFFLLMFIPESPLWLIMKQRDEKAKEVMSKFGDELFIKEQYTQIKSKFNQKVHNHSSISLLNELFSKPLRLILFIGLSIGFFQMASGINAVFFFSSKIMRVAGFGAQDSFFQSNLIGIVMVIMTFISMPLIDKLGRRPLLIIGVSIMIFAQISTGYQFKKAKYSLSEFEITECLTEIDNTETKRLIGDVLNSIKGKNYNNEVLFFNTIKDGLKLECKSDEQALKIYSEQKSTILDHAIEIQSYYVLISILLIVIGFSISLGPITWALVSEIFPLHLRGIGISIAGALNGLTSFIVSSFFPIELEKLGSATTFFIFAFTLVICLYCVIRFYPETKGKSLEQIENELLTDRINK